MGKSTKRMNELYFGDCLDVLETFGNREPFIDLIYIDPPFNSKRNFNHIFPNASEEVKDAQTLAFEDTWSNVSYQEAMSEIEAIDEPLYNVLQTFHKILGNGSGAVAYLTTMSHRLWYMHRYLKSSGSFYLHCDPTMSHYLKMICDIIFGGDNFRNEIIWQRTSTHNDAKQGAKHFGRVTDTILFYAKNRNEMKFNV
ncbi:MAG TPA: DNA methyltransferase, partial [Flavisolibacter sp.]|nr:DNA methyltransferase [Flavisolibacter sp.]